ncbi:MAG: ABC transporter permease [Prevotella sp.]|nr:ABC transporter permease [Prevotella sp.]
MSIFHKILRWLDDLAYVWRFELRQVLRDEGVLLFCIVVPIVYPLLYSWVYNNENIHEVPVAVVDQSHSQLSRQFIRMCDASPDVHVAYYAVDLDDAQSLVSRQIVKGVYLIPEDFATRVNRLEQGTVSVYCDMALMLTYKAIYQTAMAVSQKMGAGIQTKLAGKYTKREEIINASPLDVEEVAMFNPQAGYGTAILPAVLILIIQQTLALGIGLAAGTARERNRYGDLVPIHPSYGGVGRIVSGKALCYLMVYAVMSTYLVLVVPKFFSFIHIAAWQDLLLMMIPYVLACVFFGLTVSCLVRYRENVILLMVFVSLPLLFLTGVSWPQSSIPGYLQGVSWLFPSTFGVRAYLRLNTMGATLGDITLEMRCLWIQVAAYLGTACLVYGHQLRTTQKHASERLAYLRKKREVRLALKAKGHNTIKTTD